MSKPALEWNVFHENWNAKKIEKFNVFSHGTFKKEVLEALEKSKSKEELSKTVQSAAMYYFWAKCEYEIMLTSWPPSITKEEAKEIQLCVEESEARHKHLPRVFGVELAVSSKVDIYEQLLLNWDRFIDYLYDWGLAI